MTSDRQYRISKAVSSLDAWLKAAEASGEPPTILNIDTPATAEEASRIRVKVGRNTVLRIVCRGANRKPHDEIVIGHLTIDTVGLAGDHAAQERPPTAGMIMREALANSGNLREYTLLNAEARVLTEPDGHTAVSSLDELEPAARQRVIEIVARMRELTSGIPAGYPKSPPFRIAYFCACGIRAVATVPQQRRLLEVVAFDGKQPEIELKLLPTVLKKLGDTPGDT